MDKKYFTLTEDHIKLLTNSYVRWDDCEFGAPAIDSKSPYGNSDPIADMYEILEGKQLDEEEIEYQGVNYDDFVDELAEKYEPLHKELETVLQIVLHTKSFETGFYELEGYGKDWKRLNKEDE